MMQTLQTTLRGITPRPLLSSWDRLRTSPIGYRLAHGAFWSLMGTLASRSAGLISAVVIARVLGKAGYGEFGIIQSTITSFATFAGFGMGLTAAKHVAEFRRTDPLRAGRIIGLSSLAAWGAGVLMTVVCVVLASSLAAHTLAAPHLSGLIQLAAPLLLFGAVNGAQVGALNGFEAFKEIARNNLITGVISLPLNVVGVVVGGLSGAVVAQLITAVAATVLNFQVLRREARQTGIPLGYHRCLQERDVIWKFSVPAFLASIALGPLIWIANVLLVNQPAGYEKMATLSAANQWTNLVMFLPSTLMQTVLPIFSSTLNDGTEGKSFAKTLNLTQSIMMLMAFPSCTALMFSADWLMRIYWKTTPGESIVLIGCLLSSFIQLLGATAGSALQAKSKMWFGFTVNLLWGIIYVGITALLVGSLGAKALALGQVVAYLIITIWGFLYIRRNLPDGLLRRVFLGAACACIIAALCGATPSATRIWLALPATLGATAVAVFLVNAELRQAFRQIKHP